MAKQIRITFKNFTSLDLSGSRKVNLPRANRNSFGEETLLRTTLSGMDRMSPGRRGTSLVADLLDLASPPPGRVMLSGSVPGALVRPRGPDFTIAAGPTSSMGAGFALGSSGGVYFWNKMPGGEVGLFGSLSIGIISNIGFSAGASVTYLFGPAPTVLAGDAIVVSVDVGIDIATVSGMLVLNAPPTTIWPPRVALSGWVPEIIGVGFGFSIGLSALPVDISVMPSRTWMTPGIRVP